MNGRAHPLYPGAAVPALADGGDGFSHAVYRHRHGVEHLLHPKFLTLIAIHRPLGDRDPGARRIAGLACACAAARRRCPRDLPWWQAAGAKASHVRALTILLIAMPLIGWSMLSAGGYPIVLYGPIRLPPIAPHDAVLYAILRTAHTYLAYLFFATILMHIAATLFHALIRRDGVFHSMAPWRCGSRCYPSFTGE